MISKTAEYALRAVVALNGGGAGRASAETIARKTKIPRAYLPRILQELTSAGLVRSRPGPGGGYELTRSTDEVTVLDVINAVSPIERIRKCPLGLKSHLELCPLHAELDRAYEATEKAFRAVTLRALAESTSSIIPLCEAVPEG